MRTKDELFKGRRKPGYYWVILHDGTEAIVEWLGMRWDGYGTITNHPDELYKKVFERQIIRVKTKRKIKKKK